MRDKEKVMLGLVIDLQADAVDPKTRCSDLLRKALVVSRKLDVLTIEQWLRSELNGYSGDVEVPEYRRVHGSLKVWNPYQGWQPLYFQDPREAEQLASRRIGQAIGELESLVDNDKAGFLQIHFPPQIENRLVRGMDVPLQPSLHVSPTKVVGILDAVRNAILEWALELEKQGVLGENMSFSKEEKKAASGITYHWALHITGVAPQVASGTAPEARQIPVRLPKQPASVLNWA